MSNWLDGPLSEMHAVAALLIKQGVDEVDLHMVEQDTHGYERNLRMIVRKSQEGNDESTSSIDQDAQSKSLNP